MPDRSPDAPNNNELLSGQSSEERPLTIAERRRAQYVEAQRRLATRKETEVARGLSRKWNALRNLPLWKKLTGIVLFLATLGGFIQFFDYLFGPIPPLITWFQRPTPTSSPTPTPTPTLTPTATFTPTPISTPTNTPLPGPTATPSPTPSLQEDLLYLWRGLPRGIQAFCVLLVIVAFSTFVMASVYGEFIDSLQKRRRKEKEEALSKRFEEAVLRLLRERDIVCELCLSSTWRETYDLQRKLAEYARWHPYNVDFGTAISSQLTQHVSQYHSSEEATIQDIAGLTHIVRRPTWVERTRERWKEILRS
jgi:hypothetical protein